MNNKIVNFLIKHRLEILILFILAIAYFLLRLPNLVSQPIFADEAIYVRWAQVMRAEPTLRFLPLSDGKTPLFMWLMIPFFKVFQDPLYAGRFLSVLAGFGSFLGVLFLGWKFFNPKVALWSVFLLIVTPFFVFFDRMALVDSMLAMFSIWSLFLAMLLIKYQRLDIAMFLGFTLGGGILTKTPGMFNLLALPVSLISFDWKGKNRQTRLLKIFGLLLLALGIGFVMYNLLRLGPGFTSLSSRNQDYIFAPSELIGRPLDPFIPHFNDISDWLPKLLTIPILLLTILGIILSFIKREKYALTILFWSLVPLIVEMAFLKTFTARYILSSMIPLIILAGWAIYWLSEKIKFSKFIVQSLIVLVILGFTLYTDFLLIYQIEKAPLPRSERSGYLEMWTAGYGFPEIAKFLINEASKKTIVVGTEGSFGTLPDGLMIYLDKYTHTSSPDHQILLSPGNATISAGLRNASLTYPTYYVANKSRFEGDKDIMLIKEYLKIKGPKKPQDAIVFYQVFPLNH